MKIRTLFLSLGLILSACSQGSTTNKNTSVVENDIYKSVKGYSNVSYSMLGDMKFRVVYYNYSGSDETGWHIDYTKTWEVHLKGFYTNPQFSANVNVFYECQLKSGSYDYYLVVGI